MFQNPFSFEGRITRTEYALSYVIFIITVSIINMILDGEDHSLFYALGIIQLLYIPLVWFIWAQGAKRCHDRGNSGWYQLIPFYSLLMLLGDGERGYNYYGEDPKNRSGSDIDQLIDQIGKDSTNREKTTNGEVQRIDYEDWK
jgi:uncharacterized membrane protein YhaH (DUF805 family)